MFTGIIREVGQVASVAGGADGVRLVVTAPQTAGSTAIGDSVGVNGVCLTAVAVDGRSLSFDAVPETLARTTLHRLEAGDGVNVEPALRAGDPLGGHLVQGHVDGVGRVAAVVPEGDGRRVEIDAGGDLIRYCAEKGSICVEGVSLTVAGVDGSRFAVALIPHTLSVTTLGTLTTGGEVNLEVDVLAKYVERLLGARAR